MAMKVLKNLIKPLSLLLEKGSCLAGVEGLDVCLKGLAHPCANGKSWVVSQRLLLVRQQLNSDLELIAAILATGADTNSKALCDTWCQLIAARCIEAGELTDDLVLVRLISQLNGAANWVAGCMEMASLKPTSFTKLERSLLGAPAEQSQTTPILTRVLAASSRLVPWQQQALPEINKVDASGGRPDINWCAGRLVQQPNVKAAEFQYLLTGTANSKLPDAYNNLDNKAQTLAVMEWVLSHPWAYLLSLIVYEQNVWQVEVTGALLLELPAGQSELQPTAVQVLVANSDGDELYCGHLATFVQKILSSLDMALFTINNTTKNTAGITDAELNAELSLVINELLTNKVWSYVEGLSSEQGFYQIHPDFSDACYGRIGQPSFSRYARHLRQAIRSQALQWRNDCQSQGKQTKIQLNASAA